MGKEVWVYQTPCGVILYHMQQGLFRKIQIVIAIILGLGSLGLLFAISKTETQILPHPAECSIYQAFSEQVIATNSETLSRHTRSYAGLGGTPQPPRTFRAVSDPDEMFSVKTKSFFGATTLLAERDLTSCFEPHQTIFSKADTDTRSERTAHWTLSRIGVSHDEKYALVFTRRYCGNLCATGAFYLLENQEDSWRIVGTDQVWMS